MTVICPICKEKVIDRNDLSIHLIDDHGFLKTIDYFVDMVMENQKT